MAGSTCALVLIAVGCGSENTVSPSGTQPPARSSSNRLRSGETLRSGASLAAQRGPSMLTMETSGDLVLYFMPTWQDTPLRRRLNREGKTDGSCASIACYRNQPHKIWSSNTAGHSGAQLTMHADGNLQILDGSSIVWSSGSAGNPGAELTLRDDGNLVIRPPTATSLDTSVRPAVYQSGSRRAVASVAPFDGAGSRALRGQSSGLPIWATGTSTPQYVGDALPSGGTLAANQYLQSGNGQFELDMSPNGLLILFQMSDEPCPMWMQPSSAEWSGLGAWASVEHPMDPVPGSRLVMDPNGNLYLYTPTTSPIWTSSTSTPGSYLLLQDDGNLVIYAPDDDATWATSSNTYIGSALCKGMIMNTGQKLFSQGNDQEPQATQYNITYNLQFADYKNGQELDIVGCCVNHVWKDSSAPSGLYLIMQDDGNLVIYPPGGGASGTALWDTGTSGHPGAAAILTEAGTLYVVAPSISNGVLFYSVLWILGDDVAQAIGKEAEMSFGFGLG